MGDVVIRAENLGKKYVIGHEAQRDSYVSLRDVIARAAKGMASSAQQLVGMKASVAGSTKEDFWALKDINFEINEGDVVGVIGRNGAGKSTLLKVLSRITEPTLGRVSIRGRVASLLEVGTGFHPELTGRENIYLNGAILGMSGSEIQRKFDEIVDFAEIEQFLDTPVKRYSSGMYVRLAFAVAAHLEPEILIIDEVLAVGDAEFQKKCLGKMGEVASQGRTVLFVSHNMEAIQRICQSAILLSGGQIRLHDKVEACIESYFSDAAGEQDEHVLHFRRTAPKGPHILRIEILAEDDSPLPKPKTWDFVKFRVFYKSDVRVSVGSVIIYISTMGGTVLARCSTAPDSNYRMRLEEGENFVDCIFPQLLLSAGQFVIGAGLAIPNVEGFDHEPHAVNFEVHPKDVFSSGQAPTSAFPVPMPHYWTIPANQQA